jgi:hypothetical protein
MESCEIKTNIISTVVILINVDLIKLLETKFILTKFRPQNLSTFCKIIEF